MNKRSCEDDQTARRATRREILRRGTVGVGLALTGCTSLSSRQSGNTPTPVPPESANTPSRSPTSTETMEPSPTPFDDGQASPAPTCRDGYRPLNPGWVVKGPGPLGGFKLTLNRDVFERGDTLVSQLVNVGDDEETTGNKKKYDIQYRTERGWQSIFGQKEHQYHTDDARNHQAGAGFRWRLRLTQDGLSDAFDPQPTYYACAPLVSGTYRFVYWGITSQHEVETDYKTDFALGVPFEIIGSVETLNR